MIVVVLVLLAVAVGAVLVIRRRRAALRPAVTELKRGRPEDTDGGGDPPGGARTSDRVYVGNLRSRADAKEVRRRFAAFGQIVDLAIVDDRETGRFRGFVFVTMRSPAEAAAAIAALDGMSIAGRVLRVNAADPSWTVPGR